MNHYIAITFGPISRVISLAKKTRGMWAASYLFSYLAKHIIAPFKDRHFVLPYLGEELFSLKAEGAGVFPDRYIFETQTGDDFSLLAHSVDKVFSQLAQEIAIPARKDPEEVKEKLRLYLKVGFFETERKETDERAFIASCEKRLSLLEQQESFIPSLADGEHYLSQLFNARNQGISRLSFLLEDAGMEKNGRGDFHFKSIVEITSQDEGNNLLPDKPVQRYIAIVYADGDSMGKAFSGTNAQGETPRTENLSRALLAFNQLSIKHIKAFDGQPVYIGGDDLFFFAPIYNLEKKQSIFTLLATLDQDFHDALKAEGISAPAPTLSVGVSITFVKYPLSEGVKLSQRLLDAAKGRNTTGDSIVKNNVLFSLQKHSGQTYAALLHKGCEETVKRFNDMADRYIAKGQDGAGLLLNSLMHGLREDEPLLLNAITDDDRLKHFFRNNYNESVHNDYRTLIDDLCQLMLTAYKEYQPIIDGLGPLLPSSIDGIRRPGGHEAAYAAIDLSHSLLQFIHLANSKRDA